MRITIVYRYYWPDTPPYASMLRELSRRLVKEGHEVHILTAQPSYKPDAAVSRQRKNEVDNGVNVRRISLLPQGKLKILARINSLLFVFLAFLSVLFSKRSDIYWTASMPPAIQGASIALAAKFRRAHFIYHVQDIYPEIMSLLDTTPKSIIYRILSAIDGFAMRNASNVVVLSNDMKETIHARKLDAGHVRVINNLSLNQSIPASEKTKQRPLDANGPIRFVFAGNLGRFQNLERLVEIFAMDQENRISLEFMGSGAKVGKLKNLVKQLGADNISFCDHLPLEEAVSRMAGFHYGIVSIIPGLYRYAFPSKLYTYANLRLPVLAMVERESQLAELVLQAKAGISVSWDKTNVDLFKELMLKIGRINPKPLNDAQVSKVIDNERVKTEWVSLVGSLAK